MIGKKRKRQEEDPDKETGFRLRGLEINTYNIVRFEKRSRLDDQDALYDLRT